MQGALVPLERVLDRRLQATQPPLTSSSKSLQSQLLHNADTTHAGAGGAGRAVVIKPVLKVELVVPSRRGGGWAVAGRQRHQIQRVAALGAGAGNMAGAAGDVFGLGCGHRCLHLWWDPFRSKGVERHGEAPPSGRRAGPRMQACQTHCVSVTGNASSQSSSPGRDRGVGSRRPRGRPRLGRGFPAGFPSSHTLGMPRRA